MCMSSFRSIQEFHAWATGECFSKHFSQFVLIPMHFFYLNDIYWFSVLHTILVHATLTYYLFTTLTYTHYTHTYTCTHTPSSSTIYIVNNFLSHIRAAPLQNCTLMYFVFGPFYIVSWHFIIRFGCNCYKLVNHFNFWVQHSNWK